MGNTINLLEAPTIAKRHITISDQIKSKSGIYYEAERAALQAELSCREITIGSGQDQQHECVKWRLINKLYQEKITASEAGIEIKYGNKK